MQAKRIRMRIFWYNSFYVVLFATFLVQLSSCDLENSSYTPVYDFSIVKEYPHDSTAFTQGLAYEKGVLYEGTGLYGKSSLRKVDLETGSILKIVTLPNGLFGEGITIWDNKLIQLTWQSGIGLVYNKSTMNKVDEFAYPTEGWGITSDGKKLIMSDGTDTLILLDPNSFQKIGELKVRDRDRAIFGLNELEFVKEEIYANIWPTCKIAIISPQTGKILAWIDLENRIRDWNWKNVDVLNGIAYDNERDRIFITGKLWPKLFEIRISGAT
jgi:glutamine cyclotransferase